MIPYKERRWVNKLIWTESGTCSIKHLRQGRYCNSCGYRKRFLVNIAPKTWECLGCRIKNI